MSVFDGGHINDSFLVDSLKGKFLVQRINKFVFKEPIKIMENISNVTEFLSNIISQNNGNPLRETLTLIQTEDDKKTYYIDSDEEFWRCFHFIEDATAYEIASGPEMLYEVGLAFGNFQKNLTKFPPQKLHEIIKDFHNTPMRFSQLFEAAEKDSFGRLEKIDEEMKFAKARQVEATQLMTLLSQKKLPLRVTHNDTKLNNVLVDNKTQKAVAVIDLDTVMPGLAAFDYGDSIRSGTNTAAEDEADLSKVNFSIQNFEAFTKGFLEAAGGILTDLEVETLIFGPKTITLETGIRFLADYLNGDVYFKTNYETHNLVRARNQFKLVSEMEKYEKEMKEIISKTRESILQKHK